MNNPADAPISLDDKYSRDTDALKRQAILLKRWPDARVT